MLPNFCCWHRNMKENLNDIIFGITTKKKKKIDMHLNLWVLLLHGILSNIFKMTFEMLEKETNILSNLFQLKGNSLCKSYMHLVIKLCPCVMMKQSSGSLFIFLWLYFLLHQLYLFLSSIVGKLGEYRLPHRNQKGRTGTHYDTAVHMTTCSPMLFLWASYFCTTL